MQKDAEMVRFVFSRSDVVLGRDGVGGVAETLAPGSACAAAAIEDKRPSVVAWCHGAFGGAVWTQAVGAIRRSVVERGQADALVCGCDVDSYGLGGGRRNEGGGTSQWCDGVGGW